MRNTLHTIIEKLSDQELRDGVKEYCYRSTVGGLPIHSPVADKISSEISRMGVIYSHSSIERFLFEEAAVRFSKQKD